MADNEITISVDVISDAVKQLNAIAASAEKMNDTITKTSQTSSRAFDTFVGVVGGNLATKGLELIGVAALEVAKKIEGLINVFDTEKILAVHKQFDILTKNFGVNGEALKNALEKAAGGLLTTEEVLSLANRGVVEFGTNANKLPALLELSRKAAKAFGTDAAQTFESLSQAIAAGNTRALKNQGIILDVDKVYEKFAGTLGITADKLTVSEKQQALLNATLKSGEKAFSGVSLEATTSTSILKQLQVTQKETSEVLAIAFERLAGPKIRDALQFLRDWAQESKRQNTSLFGTGAEKDKATAEILRDKIRDIKVEMIDLEQKQLKGLDFTPGETASKLQILPKQLKDLETQLAATNTKLTEETAHHTETGAAIDTHIEKTVRLTTEKQKLVDAVKSEIEGARPGVNSSDLELAQVQADAQKISQQQLSDDIIAIENDRHARSLEGIALYQTTLDKNDLLYKQKVANANIAAQAENTKHQAAIEKETARRIAAERALETSKIQVVASTLGNIATLMQTKNKELFEIGRAAAIAQATVNTFMGVSNALAGPPTGPPFPLNIIFAASQGVALAVQLSNLASAHLAGGIDSVPGVGFQDNFPAVLAPGERVVPRSTNEDLKSFLQSSGGTTALLQELVSTVRSLANTTIVQIGDKVIANEVRSAIQSGRVVMA